MAMKAILDTLDGIPEGIQAEYAKREDGKFVLSIDGEVPGLVSAAKLAEANEKLDKLDEFRNNNRELKAKVDAAVAKLATFDGVNPAEYLTLKAKVAELTKDGMNTPDDIAARIQKGIDDGLKPMHELTHELKTKMEQSEKDRLQAIQDGQNKALEGILTTAAMKSGVAEHAVDDYLFRSMKVWKMVDGKPVARNGDAPMISKKTGEAITITEWSSDLNATAPHLFKPSGGAGANGNPGGGPPAPAKTLTSDDPLEFGRNLQDIADGKMSVTSPPHMRNVE